MKAENFSEKKNIKRSARLHGVIFTAVRITNLFQLYLSLSLFPHAPTLGIRASVKRFVSLQLLNLCIYDSTSLCWTVAAFSVSWSSHTVGTTPWTVDQPVARLLPTLRINAHRHQCLDWREPTIPVFERAKTVHALDRAATVIGKLLFR
jgi:hypothetical protein